MHHPTGTRNGPAIYPANPEAAVAHWRRKKTSSDLNVTCFVTEAITVTFALAVVILVLAHRHV